MLILLLLLILSHVSLRMPSISQAGILTSQGERLNHGLVASLGTTFSRFLKLVGEVFDSYVYMYPHSVLAGLIRMSPEPVHYVCSDGAQTDFLSLQTSLPSLCYTVRPLDPASYHG